MKEVLVYLTLFLPQNVLKQNDTVICSRYFASLLDFDFLSLVLICSSRSVEVYPDGIFPVGSCRWKRLTE